VKILVYGTLKMNGWNHRLIEDAKYIGDDVVDGYKLFYSGGPGSFPYAIPDEHSKMRGEVFDVTPSQLLDMDDMEGHPNWYKRTNVKTQNNDEIMMYVMEKERLISRDRNPELLIECPVNSKQQYEWVV